MTLGGSPPSSRKSLKGASKTERECTRASLLSMNLQPPDQWFGVKITENNLRSESLFALTVNQQETFLTVIHTNTPLNLSRIDSQPSTHLGLLKLRISQKECSVCLCVCYKQTYGYSTLYMSSLVKPTRL